MELIWNKILKNPQILDWTLMIFSPSFVATTVFSIVIFLPSYVMTRSFAVMGVLFVPALPAASVFTTGGPSISISTMLRCSSEHNMVRWEVLVVLTQTGWSTKGSVRVRAEHWKTEWSQVTCLWQHTTTTGTDCRTVGCILLMVSFYMSQLQ